MFQLIQGNIFVPKCFILNFSPFEGPFAYEIQRVKDLWYFLTDKMSTQESLTNLSPELINLATGSFGSVLKKLQDESNHFSKIAPSFDFENVQYNGLRTILKIIQEYFNEVHSFFLVYKRHKKEPFETQFDLDERLIKLFKRSNETANLKPISKSPLARHYSRLSSVPSKRLDQVYDDLLGIGLFFTRQFSSMHMLEEAQATPERIIVEEGVAFHPEWREIIKTFLLMTCEDLSHFYNRDIAFFWVSKWYRMVFTVFHFGRVFLLNSPTKSFQTFGNIRLQKNLTYKSSLHMFHWNLVKLARKITNTKVAHVFALADSTFKGTKHGHFKLPRQNLCGFNDNGQLDTEKAPKLGHQKKSIDCMFVRKGAKETLGAKSNYTLNLHLFGSGFVALTPDVHSIYLTDYITKTKVPVLAPKYALAPERPFPYALQDCLDVYLYLMCGENDEELQKFLGYVPQKIILTGDSAGSNLALALPIAINDYNRARALRNEPPIPLPVALGVQYPLSKAIIKPSYSYFMCLYDPFMLFPLILEFQAAYLAPELVADTEHRWYRPVKDLEATLKAHLLRLQAYQNNSYVSPFDYEHLSDLSGIPCFVQGSEFDSLMDDAVEVAKNWPGPTTLDIIPKTYHGFNAFRTKKVRRHIKEYLRFIRHYAMIDSVAVDDV